MNESRHELAPLLLRAIERSEDFVTHQITRRALLSGASAVTALVGLNVPVNAAARLEEIKKNGVLRIGVDAGFPPFSFRDKSGNLTGYDLDLSAVLCKKLGVESKLIDTQWSGIIPSLYTGHFDAIMGGISYTKDRAEKVAFTIPYAEASQALLVRSSEKIQSVDDMSDKVLGVKLASPGEVVSKRIDASLRTARGKGFSAVKTYDDFSAAYLALAQGTVDGVFNSVASMSVVLRDRPGAFRMIKGVGADSWCGIALRKQDTDLVAYLDEQLMEVRKNGKIYELQEKWFNFKMPLPDKRPDLQF